MCTFRDPLHRYQIGIELSIQLHVPNSRCHHKVFINAEHYKIVKFRGMDTIYHTKFTHEQNEAQRTETICSSCLACKRRIWIPILNFNREDICNKMLNKASGVSDYKLYGNRM